MKILMFGISPSYGGTEAVMYSMLEYFIKSGVEFDFINTFDVHLAKKDWLLSLGCNIIPLNLRKRGRYIKYRRELKKFFHKNSNKYDAIWINIQEPELGDVLNIAKKNSIKKRIVVGHSSALCDSSGLLRRISVSLSRRKIIKFATEMIAVSPLSARFTFGRSNKPVVIRSGINVDAFRYSYSARLKVRKNIGAPSNCTLFICLGRLTKQKNVAFAIDAFSECHVAKGNSKLLIIGEGDEKQNLIEKVKQLQLVDHVMFLGQVNNPSDYLAASDYYLFPSMAEGMGMSLIEAQCSGLPCFASDGPIPKEAAVTNLVHWLPLKAGPKRWADEILATPIAENREDSYKALLEAELDYASVAKKYIEILNN